jgi:hypothetical protein
MNPEWIQKFNQKKETESQNQDDFFVFALAIYQADIYVYNMPVYKKTQFIDIRLKNIVFEFIKIIEKCSLDVIVDTLKIDQAIIYSLIEILKDENKILEQEKNVFTVISNQRLKESNPFQSETIEGLKIRFRTVMSYIPFFKFMFEYQPVTKKSDFIDVKKNEMMKKEYDILFKNQNLNELYDKGFPQKYELDSDISNQRAISIIDIINQSQKKDSKSLSHLNQNRNNAQDVICALLKKDIYILVYSHKNTITSLKTIKIFITFSDKSFGTEMINLTNEIIKFESQDNIHDDLSMILFNQILKNFDIKDKERIFDILKQDKERKLEEGSKFDVININNIMKLYTQK